MISKVKKLGHEDVVSLEGGIAAWNLAGLPLVRNAS
jgi:3-mercaptopyruvate sulfurtransferase SseA